MISFITENLGTIFVGLVVAAAVVAIVVKIAGDKRKGKCIGCECSCRSCPGKSLENLSSKEYD